MTSPSTPSAPPARHLPFRGDINGLRALSVALVVLFHARVRGAAGGFIGVDVFFVISGFLMTRIILDGLQAGRFTYLDFLRARAMRIWPALGAMVLGLMIIAAVALPPSDLLHMAQQAIWPLIFWSNQNFLEHAGYDTAGADGHWFLQTWSLSVEWQFYLLYPLLLMLLARGRAWLVRGGVWLAFLASLAVYLARCRTDPAGAFFLLSSRAWELLAGALVIPGIALPVAAGARVRTLASYAGVALIVFSALWLGVAHVDAVGVGWRSALPVLGAALVLWADAQRSIVLDNRPAQAIGRWSYSIYLWHWPIVVFCAMDAVVQTETLLRLALIGLGAVAFGAASFRWIESSRQRWRPLALMGAAGLAAALGYATDGLKARMPELAPSAMAKLAVEADYFPRECSNFRKPIGEVRPCLIDHGGRRVLVIGDSFAESLWPWFRTHSHSSVEFLTEADCPPVPHFEQLLPGFHCADYAALAWRRAADPRYDTVIVSARWENAGAAGAPYCHQEPGGACRVVVGEEKARLLLAELRAAVTATLAAGRNVVVLQGSPEADVDVPARLERERYWFGEPRLVISAAAVVGRNAWIDSLWESFRHAPGFFLLSLRPVLCNALSCATYDQVLRHPVYIDDRHFDPLWIEAHGGIFQPFVEPQPPHWQDPSH